MSACVCMCVRGLCVAANAQKFTINKLHDMAIKQPFWRSRKVNQKLEQIITNEIPKRSLSANKPIQTNRQIHRHSDMQVCMCVFMCEHTAQNYTNRNACLTRERRCIAENTWQRSLKPGVTLAGAACLSGGFAPSSNRCKVHKFYLCIIHIFR